MKHSLWIALFLCGVLLAACTKQNSPLLADAPASSVPEAASAAPAASDAELTVLTQWDAETGYYYLARENGGDFVLHFVDFATLQDAPVCSAGCAHTDEGCTARIAWEGCDVTVYTAREQLFVVWQGAPWENDGGQARILCCERDGSDRKELARFDASVSVAGPPAWDGRRLYCILADYTDGKAEKRLLILDPATGEQQEQTGLPLLDTAIVGACGRELVLRFGEGTQAGWGLWNVDSGSWKELVRGERPVSAACDGEALYLLENPTGSIRRLPLAGGGETTLATDLNQGRQLAQAQLQAAAAEGFLVRGEEDGVFDNYLIDPQGHTVKQTLATAGELGDFPLEVFAETQDAYLVATGYSVGQVELPEDGGVVDETRYTFAMLPKEDFWADRPNYNQ